MIIMRKRTERVIRSLERRYPGRGFSRRGNPFRVLISTVLSQRTRDENTEKASRRLFSRFGTPGKLARAPVREIEELIKEAGFYRVKARKIREISRIIMKKYRGRVPLDMEKLVMLPGVGKKTASCTLLYGFGESCIPVDVHVAVISRRLDLTEGKNPDDIQDELERAIPREKWSRINGLMVMFGKEICRTNHPKCGLCDLTDLCSHYKEYYRGKSRG
jgi:endonuclease-3